MARRTGDIESFGFEPGRRLAGKYEIESFLGRGWEGEAYRVVETRTGVTRAAKFFFPQRNRGDRSVKFYARKLERLRACPIIVQYHHSESFWFRGHRVTFLVSEFVEGKLLSQLIAAQPGKRMLPFEAMHLLHALAEGMEPVHLLREYHGDLHDDNVLVERHGAFFNVRLVDLYPLGRPDGSKIKDDVAQLVRLFYDAIGGQRMYARQPPEVKEICLGLRRDLIARKFPTAGHLRSFLESFPWRSR
ncbi:MAG: serine/threonine protein kinase [Acidobacteriota bacterium]|nr:serine/threonine protein kinase [Acidobacteriota bacterium]